MRLAAKELLRLTVVIVALAPWGSIAQANVDDALRALQSNDFGTALRLLRGEASKGDTHAEVVLAQLLLNGKAGVEDPAEAAMWYQKAAANPPNNDQYVPIAQFNLGALFWAGKGVPKDVGKALKFYNLAATNGFQPAQETLVGIYARGDQVTPDNVQALKWALVLAAKGDRRAHQIVDALKARMTPVEQAEARAAAQQVFPGLTLGDVAPTPSAQHGAPREPVSQAAGYTPLFAAIHQQPPENNMALVRQIKGQMNVLPPPYFYELARRTFPDDHQEGVAWFWLARMRAYYDASRCVDGTALESVQEWNAIADDVVSFIHDHPDISRRGKQIALDRDASLPANSSPAWICGSGIAAIAAAAHGQIPDKLVKPESEWSTIHATIRAQFEKAVQEQ